MIKVWDVVTAHQLASTCLRIAKSLNLFSEDYLQRCRQKSDRSPFTPQRWEHDEKFVPQVELSNKQIASQLEDSDMGESCTLKKAYPLTSNIIRLLLQSDENSELELPHDVSAEEKALIEDTASSLFILGRSGTGKTTVMVQKMFRQHMTSMKLDPEGRPVVQLMVTASPVLAGAIKRHFEGMINSTLRQGEVSNTAATESESVSDGVPTSTTSAQSNNPTHINNPYQYPHIISFGEFLQKIDCTLKQPFFRSEDEATSSRSIVDMFRFESYYYPRMGDVTGGKRFKISPSALYTQIMSAIKGSMDAPRLTRDQYVALATKRSSANINADERHHYYDLYELYQRLKAETTDYDTADLVSHIYRALESGDYDNGLKYSGIFVDEVQDLTMRQLSILRFVSEELNGFCFAGDTAQTIAHGVGFRFESLKDLFYAEFIRGRAGYKVPEISQLKQNFRTHTDVLRVANTIIKLITELFPDTIDKLDDESSLTSGRKPIFIQDTDDVISELFDRGDLNNSGFGADQVILVRDEETK